MKLFLYAFVGVLMTVAVVGLILSADDSGSASTSATAVPHFQSTALRTVAFTANAQVSRGQDPMLVQLVDGTIPGDVRVLHVVTDENCTPDASGVSHCLNRVRFVTSRGTGEATLQHHHRMDEESCLAPGETVKLAV
jgi:hypothetical protein